MRQCPYCPEKFESDAKRTEVQKFADHLMSHQPTPAQWAEAYKRIQEGKERAKGK